MSKMINGFLVLLFMAVLPLAGCSTSSPRTDIPVAAEGMAPISPLAESFAPYRLQLGDIIQVKMLLNPELNEDVSVRPDGKISTAVVQDMQAYGKTSEELQKNLIESYKKYLIDPQLTVVVKSFAPSKVYVIGEVTAPGEIVSVGPNMTLLQALARAGGLKNSADESNILVYRRGASEKAEVFRADYNGATSGDNPAQDVRLAAYDVVFVPRTKVADAYKNYQQNIQQFLPASFGLGYSVP